MDGDVSGDVQMGVSLLVQVVLVVVQEVVVLTAHLLVKDNVIILAMVHVKVDALDLHMLKC